MGKGDYSSSDFVPTGDMNDPANIQKNAYDKLIHDQNRGSKSGGGGGGGMIVLIILLIPYIISKVIGVIFAFLGKLGIIGKFLQTILFSVTSVIVLAFSTGMFAGHVLGTLAIPVFVLAALWYWLFHYDEIKLMSIKEYSNSIKVSMAIVLYGFIFNVVFVAGIAQALFGETAAWIALFLFMFILFAVAILVYLVRISDYREEAAKERKNAGLKKTILIVAAVYMVVAVGSTILADALGLERKSGNIDLTGRTTVDAAAQGTTARVVTANAEVFPSLSGTARPIKRLSVGDEVTVIGVNRRYPDWTEIMHEGTKGWIESENIRVNR